LDAEISNILDNDHNSSSITYLDNYTNEANTYEQLMEKGFSAKSKKDSTWTTAETKLLKEVCADIKSKRIQPQVQDLMYYISHYTFQGVKSKAEIEGMINRQIRSQLEQK